MMNADRDVITEATRDRRFRQFMFLFWATAIIVAVSLSVVLVMAVTDANASTGRSRQWTVAYNSALSLHECACPGAYDLGDRLKIEYKGKTLRVKVMDTGPYFDISDEGMNVLASTSKGLIKATVTEL